MRWFWIKAASPTPRLKQDDAQDTPTNEAREAAQVYARRTQLLRAYEDDLASSDEWPQPPDVGRAALT